MKELKGKKSDIKTAKDLYKYYLDLSEAKFKELLEDCGANSLNQKRAYNGMDEWHKQYGFVNQPMETKLVDEVPGIGDAISKELKNRDIETAEDLYQYYLEHSQDEFKELLEDCGANGLNQKRAYYGMNKWHKKYGSLE